MHAESGPKRQPMHRSPLALRRTSNFLHRHPYTSWPISLRMKHGAWGLGLVTSLAGAAGCAGAKIAPPPSAEAPVVTVAPKPERKAPCDQARALRAQVPSLLGEGRLDRTLRTIANADRLCPSEAASSWDTLVLTLADIGRYAEARALCDKIDATKDAPAPAKSASQRARSTLALLDQPSSAQMASIGESLAREAHLAASKGDPKIARAKYLAAWETSHPNGAALLGAALATRALGDAPEAQRLLDRAVVDYERATGGHMELDVPNGFGGFVNALAFSPAGDRLAIAHRTVVSLVDATTMRERVRLRGHAQPVTGVAFSPDGKSVATSSRDETARVWDAATGRELLHLEGHTGEVAAVAFDHEGTLVATAGHDHSVRLWDAHVGGAARFVLEGHAAPVTAVAFAPNGKHLASTSDDHTVIVWDLASKKLVAKGTAASALRSVSFASLVASGGEDGVVHLGDANKDPLGKALAGHTAAITGLSFAPTGKLLASSSLDTSVRIWDVASATSIKTLEGHAVMALSPAWSSDGKRLASGAFDTVHVWDASTWTELARLEGHADAVTSVAFSADGKSLAVGAADRAVRVYGVSGARRLDGHAGAVTALSFSPDGSTLASGSLDGTVRRWAFPTMAGSLPIADVGAVASLAWSPDGKSLATASPDKSLRLWDVAWGKPIGEGGGPGAYGVAFSADGKRVAFAAIGRVVIVRDVASGKELARLVGHEAGVNGVAWSADGALLATASADRTVRLWDGATYAQKGVLTASAPVVSVAMRPTATSGLAIAAGTTDGSVNLYSVSTSKLLMRIAAHADAVQALAFSPDGALLATGARDGTTELFSIPDGQLLLSIRGVAARDASYAFAPTGEIEIFGEARDFPICRIGALSVPFELCEERFVEKGLLARIMKL